MCVCVCVGGGGIKHVAISISSTVDGVSNYLTSFFFRTSGSISESRPGALIHELILRGHTEYKLRKHDPWSGLFFLGGDWPNPYR